MKVLVTGAKGFVGRNLCESLKAIRDGKDERERCKPLLPLEIYECDVDTPQEELSFYCAEADFVFNLAGVNRPEDPADFMRGNAGFGEGLLDLLEHHGNGCPVMLASSAQASLEGRYAGSAYGESKLAAEEMLFAHAERTGAKALVYRFPNVYGKWCRPNYNSAIATFCDAVANGRECHVDDPSAELELLHIDDLVAEMLSALLGEEHRCRAAGAECVPDPHGMYCHVPETDRATLGEAASLLESFAAGREALEVPRLAEGSFGKKLYSTFLSYRDAGTLSYPLDSKSDERGSFAEFLRTPERGQVSVVTCRPGQSRGNHWHHSKWEKFLVVSGEGAVRMRRIGLDRDGNPYPVDEYRVSGREPVVVETPPGHTHAIVNLSETEDLVAVVWASECFDPEDPDTFSEEV